MTKKYVIRKSAFHSSDDHLYFATMGAVVSNIYTDYQEAYDALMDLERKSYLEAYLWNLAPFSICSDSVEMSKMVGLKYYFEKELGLNMLKFDDYGNIFADRDDDVCLPENITNEQIEKIRDMSGLKFHELIEFADEPQFFGIWKKSPFYENEGFLETGAYGKPTGSIYFYNSYMDAYNVAIKEGLYSINEVNIKGKLEDITDMPVILNALIKTTYGIDYDEKEETLTIKKNLYLTHWASLCSLLRNRPFEIKLLNLEDVKDCDHNDYYYQ